MFGKLAEKHKECLFLTLALVVALFVFLYNLDNQYLWQDEAQTALVSKTILTHGIPLGYDGKNFFSQQTKDEYGGKYIWKWHTWMPFYLVAVSFKIFGTNTFAARLPFALFGVATVLLTYFFTKSLSNNRKTTAIATILLLLSVSFIILSRQCRYYSLIAFFSLLGLYSYSVLPEKQKTGSAIFLLSAILIFHCHQLFCVILLASVFIHSLICNRQQLVKIFILSVIIVLINFPWLIFSSEMTYTEISSLRFFNHAFFWYLKQYLLQIHYYIFPFFLLLIPVSYAVFLAIKHKSIKDTISANVSLWKNLFLLFLFVVLTVVILSIASPDPYFRYMGQLIPVFCIITAVIITLAVRPHFKPAIITIAILFGLVFLIDYRYTKTHPEKKGIKYLNIFDYIDEITHDYNGPIEGIVKYLNEHGDEDDVVAITYGDLPLKFYTKMRVIGGLTGEDLSESKQANWVILRKNIVIEENARVAQYLVQNLQRENYEKIVIDYPDIAFENREDPAEHHFRTVVDEDRVVIYRKVN